MLRRLLPLLFLLLPAVAQAQLGSVPHTFVADTTILASEVNTNFSTVYSTALNRTGGTMTGTLTSQQITPAATNTYDLGTTGTRFRDAWLSRDLIVGRDVALSGSLSDTDSALTVADQLIAITTTVPQLSLRYDASNTLNFGVSSTGVVTVDAEGAAASFSFSDPVNIASFTGTTSVSGAWTFTEVPVIATTAPRLQLTETDATANEGKWWLVATGDTFQLQSVNDAQNSSAAVLTVSRTGTTVDAVDIGAAQLRLVNGTIAAPALAFSSDAKAGLWATTDGIVMSAQDAAAGAGDDAGVYVTATASEGIVQLASGNGSSGSGATLYVRGNRIDMSGGYVALPTTSFGTLPTPLANGAIIYCSDCTIASPCAGGGTGAIAKRLNGAWVCN
jgi:hypothetical protein